MAGSSTTTLQSVVDYVSSMGELGRHAPELHRAVGEFAAGEGVDFMIAVGLHAESCRLGALAGGMSAESIEVALDAEEATTKLLAHLRAGDAVLVKGSHFMGLENLVAAVAGKGGA